MFMKKILSIVLLSCICFSAFSNATVTQKEWRWRKDAGSQVNPVWETGQNEAPSKTICKANENILLRMAFLVQYDPMYIGYTSTRSVDWKISYATSPTGTFTKISNVAGSNHFVLSSGTSVSGSDPTTQLLTSTGGGFLAGSVIDANRNANIVFTTPAAVNSLTEYEWVITPTINVLAQTYYFKLENLNGYDATLPSITIIPAAPTTFTQTKSACSSFLSPSEKYTWKTSGEYKDTLKNAAGCDSVITTLLTINNNTGDTTAVACDKFLWYGKTYTGSGTDMHTFKNAAGCDSVVTLHLTINTVDASIVTMDNMITADNASATYVWVNCTTETPIPQETSQSFTATTSGSYAVIVTEKGCPKMSECTSIVITGLNESIMNAGGLIVHPNPNNGNFAVDASSPVSIEMYNPMGQLVLSKMISEGTNNFVLENAASGVYYLSSKDKSGNSTHHRIVISK
jgi:hypothetical protein